MVGFEVECEGLVGYGLLAVGHIDSQMSQLGIFIFLNLI